MKQAKSICSLLLLLMLTASTKAQLKVTTSGNVSIGGNFTAERRLHVLGNALFTNTTGTFTSAPMIRANIIYSTATTPDYTWYADTTTGIFHPSSGSIIGFSIAGIEKMRVHSNGYIGIGIASPGSALDVKGTLRLSGATSGYVGFAPAAVAGSTTYTLPGSDGTSGQVLKTNGSATLSWMTPISGSGTSAQVAFWSGTSSLSSSSNLYWDNTNGRLGVGTSTPTEKLQVAGNIKIDSPNELYFAGNGIIRSSDNNHQIIINQASNEIELREYGKIVFSPGAISGTQTAKVVILSDGKTGIGTTSPASKFDVEGGVSIGASYSGTTAAPSNGMIVEGTLGIATSAPNTTYKLYVNGLTFCSSGTWTASDSRFKKNIKPIEKALEKIMKMKGKTYEFKTEEFKERNFSIGSNVGFIAQELKEILPEAVKQEENGYYSVNYMEIIPVLVEGIKEQQETIEKLSKELTETQTTMETMRSEVGDCCKTLQNSSMSQQISAELKGTILYQNIPNPFTEKTQINYTIGIMVQNISISIFDMQGGLLKTYDRLSVSDGKGSITINGGELRAGMYMYSLIIDGKEIDTKRMILTK
jgi:hypothetical protein